MFAELAAIDQSSGKTAGLRQTKKVNGKRIVENDKSNVMTEAKKKKIAKMRGLGGTKKKEVAKVKSPVCELRGKKWAIENQVGMCTLDAEKCDKKYSTRYTFTIVLALPFKFLVDANSSTASKQKSKQGWTRFLCMY